MLPDDPQFDAWVAQVAPSLNVPPAVPRLEMWDAIQAAQKTAAAANAGAIAGVTPLRRARFLLPVAVAAALLLGVAIDRFTLHRGGESRANTPSTHVAVAPITPSSTDSVSDPSRLYRLAAVQTLTQAEALLTAYRSSGVAERDPAAAKQLGQWGREVLSSTRLLLDSPAGDDATLRPLLNDLELVLVQIIRLSGAPLDENDRALIDDAMRVHNLLATNPHRGSCRRRRHRVRRMRNDYMNIRRLLCTGAIAIPASLVMPASQAPRLAQADTQMVVQQGDIAETPPAPWADTDPADSLYRAGREAINRAEYRRAASIFAEISRRFPKSEYAPDAYYWRAFALYKSGREDDLRDALRALDTQQKSFPKAKTIGRRKDAGRAHQRRPGQDGQFGERRIRREISQAERRLPSRG